MNQFEDELKSHQMRLGSHDDQLFNMNKLCDENARIINKLHDANEKLRHSNELLQDKIDKCEKQLLKINNELLRFNEIEKNIKENRCLIDENSKNINDFQYQTNKKFSENDSNILNIINTLQELSKLQSNSQKSAAPITSHLSSISTNDNNSATLDLINKANKEIENMKKQNKDMSEKIEKVLKNEKQTEDMITELKTKITNPGAYKYSIKDETDKKSSVHSADGLDLKLDPDIISPSQSIEIIYDQIQKMQDAIKNVSMVANAKPSREEVDKISRIANSETEKLSAKLNDSNKNLENKIKQILQSLSEFKNNPSLFLGVEQNKPNQNLTEEKIQETIINSAKAMIENEFPNKIIEYFNSNNLEPALIKEGLEKIELNKIDIQKINEEISSLHNSITETKNFAKFEQRVIEHNRRINDLEHNVIKNRESFEEKIKNLEGDGFSLEENESNEEFTKHNQAKKLSFTDALRYVNQNLKTNIGKLDKVVEKQDNMNSEILHKVKKDLSIESGKILEEFRHDLKNSIGRIEDQLREKVDRFSLDEFGRRVDNKLHSEFNKKIDRNDLKKNNNLINKKIDTLENKISKTLVDTLIDLQMDDAPLIVKKSMNGGEKCASCNQVIIHGKENIGYQTFYGGAAPFLNNVNHDEESKPNNMNMTQGKFKFRNIQDNSNKFGTGSYSRYLSNIDNVNEDLKHRAVHLPDISARNMKNIKNSMGNTFTKIKIDEYAGKQFNSMINEELEKNIVNPDNLIKTANKIFESVEKRNMKEK